MSNTFARTPAHRLIGAVGWFIVWGAAISSLVLAFTSVPAAWWPETGQAFAASHSANTQPAQAPAEGSAACDLIVGPALDYCLRSVAQAAPPAKGSDSGISPAQVLLLVPVALALTAAARQRRKTP
ncbi:hypothetical protein ACIGN6_31820 [Streptomyces sp. NPDC053792]|uniref:hypothetical protein n=1 Tax=Streptomyces sp. NPDC053792 TaxID=3365716 RepID=UPI0037D47784